MAVKNGPDDWDEVGVQAEVEHVVGVRLGRVYSTRPKLHFSTILQTIMISYHQNLSLMSSANTIITNENILALTKL